MCQTRRVTARWTRRYRRRPSGRLVAWLVSPEAMREALQYLLADTERYVITIRRSRFNWDSGQSQTVDFVLFENDSIDLSDSLDLRLLRSRRVIILLADKEKGVVSVNLTGRSWAIWKDSPKLREKLISFNYMLTAGARRRFIRPSYIFAVLTAPFWSSFALFVLWSVSGARSRYLTYNYRASGAALTAAIPPWLEGYVRITIALWPAFIALSFAMLSIIVMGGGLQIWPESLTFKTIAGALYRIRGSTVTPSTATAIVVGAVTAVISAALTFWFTH